MFGKDDKGEYRVILPLDLRLSRSSSISLTLFLISLIVFFYISLTLLLYISITLFFYLLPCFYLSLFLYLSLLPFSTLHLSLLYLSLLFHLPLSLSLSLSASLLLLVLLLWKHFLPALTRTKSLPERRKKFVSSTERSTRAGACFRFQRKWYRFLFPESHKSLPCGETCFTSTNARIPHSKISAAAFL